MELTRLTSVALVLAVLWATPTSADNYPLGSGISCSFLPKDCTPDPAISKFCMSKDVECNAFRWSESNPRDSMIPLFKYSESWTQEDATKLVADSYNHYRDTGQFPVLNGAGYPLLPVCYDPDGHLGEMRLGIDHHQLPDNEQTFPCWCGQDGSDFFSFVHAGSFMTDKRRPVIYDRCRKLSMNDGQLSPVEHIVQVCNQWHDASRQKPAECDPLVTEYAALLGQKFSIPEATCRTIATATWDRVTYDYGRDPWQERWDIDVLDWVHSYEKEYHCFDANPGGDPACASNEGTCGCKEPAEEFPPWFGHHNMAWWLQSDMVNDLAEHYADHYYRRGEHIMCSGLYCLMVACQGPGTPRPRVNGSQIVELLHVMADECPGAHCAAKPLDRAAGYQDKGLLELKLRDSPQCAGLCGANEPARPVLTLPGDSWSGRFCAMGHRKQNRCPGGLPT